MASSTNTPDLAALIGDIVSIPPNTKHWHGAAPETSMAHIALVERLDGKSTITHLAFYSGWPNAISASRWRKTC